MISRHCGQRLAHEYGRSHVTPNLKFHCWKCIVCGRRFKQAVRRPGTLLTSTTKESS